MCGIAGIFHLETAKPVDPARLRAMTDVLAHRGPDGSGVWTAQGVGLGHRRLAIIDLAGGAQPMHSAEGDLVLSYNGEIYNFQEVRAELEGHGHRFATNSDSEVILYAWRQWGRACLTRLNGMFAFALYDQRAQSLFLARDRLGVKPLHYAALADGSVIFGSELKALLAHPLLRREPDIRAVEDYLAFGYVPDHRCMIRGVNKLPAGHYLLLERGKALPEPSCYWDLDYSRRHRGSADDLAAQCRDLLGQAVRSRMIADVPLGAFLSGGVDSSSVVALMAEASKGAVRTCSIGFDEASLDETAYARRIAERYRTDHREALVAADDFSLIDTLADHFDEPFADASALPTYRVAQLAREHVTVALSGDGADEAFAGYRRHVFHYQEGRLRALLPAGLRRSVFGTLGALYPKADWAPRPLRAKATLLGLAQDGDSAYAQAIGVTPPLLRHGLYSAAMRTQLGDYRAETHMLRLMRAAPARSELDRAQYADMKLWLPGDILTKVDRTSMAVSLEAREPLLDYRLIEFAAALPDAMRVRGGQGKWLMKRAMAAHLPEDILYRPKMGFVTPISLWFRGALAGEAQRICASGALAQSGWFAPERLAAIAQQHQSGVHDHGRLLWQLLMLEKSLLRLFAL